MAHGLRVWSMTARVWDRSRRWLLHPESGSRSRWVLGLHPTSSLFIPVQGQSYVMGTVAPSFMDFPPPLNLSANALKDTTRFPRWLPTLKFSQHNHLLLSVKYKQFIHPQQTRLYCTPVSGGKLLVFISTGCGSRAKSVRSFPELMNSAWHPHLSVPCFLPHLSVPCFLHTGRGAQKWPSKNIFEDLGRSMYILEENKPQDCVHK